MKVWESPGEKRIEEVAEAIYNAVNEDEHNPYVPSFDELVDAYQELFRSLARVALTLEFDEP